MEFLVKMFINVNTKKFNAIRLFCVQMLLRKISIILSAFCLVWDYMMLVYHNFWENHLFNNETNSCHICKSQVRRCIIGILYNTGISYNWVSFLDVYWQKHRTQNQLSSQRGISGYIPPLRNKRRQY